jgi:Fic family protein
MARRIATFIHELDGWPDLRWTDARVTGPLAAARLEQGRLMGQLEALGFEVRDDAVLRAITDEVVKSSEIEGERLDAAQVRSSVARRLGLEVAGLTRSDRYVDGIVEMMLDATQAHDKPLTEDRLLGWHAALSPTGRSGMHRVKAGAWRDDQSGPMQVVSGPVGREGVHFVAPRAGRLKQEMGRFLDWFNADEATEPVLKAAQAHLWFVTVHPFDDGNGRIARAITELALARSERSARRFYSLSAQIREERADYYRVLELTQRGSLDITQWVVWFLECLTRAIWSAERELAGVLARARFWEQVRDIQLNDRQRLMLNRLLEGFEGKLTSSKWATMTKTSHDSALRDIQQLVVSGLLVKDPAGGRSTSYSLAGAPPPGARARGAP